MIKGDWLQQLQGYNVEASSAPARRARSLHALGNIATIILSEALAESKDPAAQA